MNLEGTGIDPSAMERFLREQVYSLPGTDRHEQAFTVLLTGSRASGTHGPRSDVDLDVLCPRAVYEPVLAASRRAGLIRSGTSFFCVLQDDRWWRYFGRDKGRPHFSLTPLETVRRQVRHLEDVPLWIWTNARVLRDPGGRFRRLLGAYKGYPPGALVRKIKYHWLLSAFWAIDVFPHHGVDGGEVLSAGMSILNAVSELMRVFFLVEGRPYPYTEKLPVYAGRTRLGRRFGPMLGRAVDLAVGARGGRPPWPRLRRAFRMLFCSDASADCRRLEAACGRAMVAAGVEPAWVRADYENIEELLTGALGPVP